MEPDGRASKQWRNFFKSDIFQQVSGLQSSTSVVLVERFSFPGHVIYKAGGKLPRVYFQ